MTMKQGHLWPIGASFDINLAPHHRDEFQAAMEHLRENIDEMSYTGTGSGWWNAIQEKLKGGIKPGELLIVGGGPGPVGGHCSNMSESPYHWVTIDSYTETIRKRFQTLMANSNSRTSAARFKHVGERVKTSEIKLAVALVRHPVYRKAKHQRRSLAVRNFLATRGVDLRFKY